MSNISKKLLLSLSTCLVATVFIVTPVLAVETTPKAQTYLTNAKLQSCLAQEAAIQTRSTNLTRMANKMLEKFDSIATRVKDYYVRSGKTVARYSVLVTEVQTRREAVVTAMTAATTDVSGFNCTSNDPKGHMTAFLKDMRLVKSTLNDYRTSIKNLIVAVRTATAEKVRSQEPSDSPSDSTDPKSSKTPNPRSNSQGRGNN